VVVVIEAGIEQFAQARFDALGQAPCHDDEGFLLRHRSGSFFGD
jgi:hypothetical protein